MGRKESSFSVKINSRGKARVYVCVCVCMYAHAHTRVWDAFGFLLIYFTLCNFTCFGGAWVT